MGWSKKTSELIQIITADGETFDFSTNSKRGNWVLEASGFGMPDINYLTNQGPFQHGESVRDYRLKPRGVQLLLRQQACDRDDYWDRRTELLNALRPNRHQITFNNEWIIKSQYQAESQTYIMSLCEFNNKLYGGTGVNGRLFQWDGSGQWVQVADTLNAQDYIWSLIVYGDELYGGTSNAGRLFKWNGVDAWTQVANTLNVQTTIYDMVIFDDGLGGGDQIFAGTGLGGRLFHSAGAGWAQDCAQLGGETRIYALCVYDDGGGDDLYGGTGQNGLLYRYNPAGPAWVQVCAQLNGQTDIYSLCVYNGQLYGGTGAGGRLFRYDVAGAAWEQVAGQYGTVTMIYKLIVYKGRLYGSGNDGYLLRWNGTDAWEEMAAEISSQEVRSLYSFKNGIYGGSTNGAYLLKYQGRTGVTTLPCATLRRYLSDGEIRDLCVYIDKGPQFKGASRGWDEFSIEEPIRLFAPDPTLYDPEEQDGPTYTMDPLATGNVNESQDVTYSGTWEEHPTFVLTGPINNPIIRNNDTDELIELDYNIPAGRVVTITLTPGNQTIEDDLGNNLMGVVTTDSDLQMFHLAPDPEVTDGVNEINIQGTGTNAATDFSFTYYNRYIGI